MITYHIFLVELQVNSRPLWLIHIYILLSPFFRASLNAYNSDVLATGIYTRTWLCKLHLKHVGEALAKTVVADKGSPIPVEIK